jgi:hypothetical protein
MQQPPLLPEETLHRVLRVAKVNGMSVLMIAGFVALVSAMGGEYMGAIFGLLVAGAGAIELHGEGLLREGRSRGMSWLVGSQLYLMTVVIVYCAIRLTNLVIPPIPESLRPILELGASQWGMTTQEYILMVWRLNLRLFALLTFFYQGGMAFYYVRRREPVARALGEE